MEGGSQASLGRYRDFYGPFAGSGNQNPLVVITGCGKEIFVDRVVAAFPSIVQSYRNSLWRNPFPGSLGAMGFLISGATPAATRPIAASRSLPATCRANFDRWYPTGGAPRG